MRALSPERPERFVTIPQLAELRQLKPSYLYEMSRTGRLPGRRKIGKFVRISLDEFDEATRVT